MKILHITADWKWTGPAAPMLQLLLSQRARGCTADLVCPEPEPGATASLVERAREAGVAPVLTMARGQGALQWSDRLAARRLAQLVSQRDYEIVHTWHTRDHVLAVRALGGRRRQRRTTLVRSYRNAESIPAWPWNRWLFGRGTDALLCVSPRAAEINQAIRRGRPVRGELGAVDLTRFAPVQKRDGVQHPEASRREVRKALGLKDDDLVIGIVARVQRHRRFDLLLAAFGHLLASEPRARLLILGRGTHLDEVARAPARELGMADRVCFAGYRDSDYADALRAADIFTYLVPGSDGTCRALLEAAACGLPAVVSRRGALPEIVVDGETGFVVDEDPEALASAWGRLLAEPALAEKMGAAARERAERMFEPGHYAERVAALYRVSSSSS